MTVERERTNLIVNQRFRDAFGLSPENKELDQVAINFATECLQESLLAAIRQDSGYTQEEFDTFITENNLMQPTFFVGEKEVKEKRMEIAIIYLKTYKINNPQNLLQNAYDKLLKNGIFALYSDEIIASKDATNGISPEERKNGPKPNSEAYLASIKHHTIAYLRAIPVDKAADISSISPSEQQLIDAIVEITQGYFSLIPKVLSSVQVTTQVRDVLYSIWTEHLSDQSLVTSRVATWRKAAKFYSLFGISTEQDFKEFLTKDLGEENIKNLMESVNFDQAALRAAIIADNPEAEERILASQIISYAELPTAWKKAGQYPKQISSVEVAKQNTELSLEKLTELGLAKLVAFRTGIVMLTSPSSSMRDRAISAFTDNENLKPISLINGGRPVDALTPVVAEELLHLYQMDQIARQRGADFVDHYFKLTGEAYAEALVSSIKAVMLKKKNEVPNSAAAPPAKYSYTYEDAFREPWSHVPRLVDYIALKTIISNPELSDDELSIKVSGAIEAVANKVNLGGMTANRLILTYLETPGNIDSYPLGDSNKKQSPIGEAMTQRFGVAWVTKPEAIQVFFNAVDTSVNRGNTENTENPELEEANYILSQG